MAAHNNFHLPLLSIFAALILTSAAGAQNRTSSDANELLMLAGQQTVVTASKKAQRVSDAPSAVTVITEEEIRASGATTLMDVLRYAPGVDVSESNRSRADVSVRGFNTQFISKLLVMVDGRSIYSEFVGGVYWNTIPLLLSRIKRIEIVRGPGSALYGANAFNGVINIITKSPAELAGERAKTSVRTLIGEQNTQLSEAVTTVGDPKKWAFTLGAAYNHTDGFGGRKAGQVRDSYSTPVVTADLQKRFRKGNLILSAGNSESTSDLYSTSVYYNDVKYHTSYLNLLYDEDRAKNPILARIFGNFVSLTQPGFRPLDNQTVDAEIQQTHQLGSRQQLVYGASFRHVQVISNITGPNRHNEDSYGLYLQDDWRLARRTHLFAGLRVDDDSLYGVKISPRVSIVHRLPHAQSVRMSYGTAFRNPTILNTYDDIMFDEGGGLKLHLAGNSGLKPEQVISYDAGYRKDFARGDVAVNLFYNKISDILVTAPFSFAPSPPFPPGVPTEVRFVNGASAHAAGVEFETDLKLSRHVRGQFNYAFQEVADSNGNPTDQSPKHKVNVALRADLTKRVDAFLGLHYVSSTIYTYAPKVFSIGEYTRVDARIGYKLRSGDRPWKVSLVATNLLDDKHLEFPLDTNPGAPPVAARQRRTLYFMIDGRF